MTDCMNAEIRDQLPELVHDRLSAARRAEVLAHVAMCADCRDEIELLRAARAMFDAQTPRVDVSYVVNALPSAKPRTVRLERRRPVWSDWRIAAAVTLIVAGGSSVAVMSRDRANPVAVRDTVQQPRVAAVPLHADAASSAARTPVATQPHEAPTTTAVVASDEQGSGLGSSRLGDLTEQQLKTLLNDIDQLQPTPITDPEPVSLRVRDNAAGGPEGAL